jgi:tetratricopeptide (TPR) repeat protein
VSALLLLSAPVAAQEVPTSDGIIALRHREANELMAEGDYKSARDLYYLLLESNEDDVVAQREAGRASHALGDLQLAVRELRRALKLENGLPDPEAHYLLGEALYATGEPAEARKEQAIAAREIGPHPSERMPALWLARIYARQRKIAAADEIYQSILDREQRKTIDQEVAFARIEARTMAKDWSGAERLLREFLDQIPGNERAMAMLAWTLEAQGKVDEERKVRVALAKNAEPVDAAKVLALARTLERGNDYDGAITRYREALALGADNDQEIRRAIDRLSLRLSPETSVGAAVRSDPSGSERELRAGVAIPMAADATVSFAVGMDMADGDMMERSSRIATAQAALLLGQGHPVTAAFMVSGSFAEFEETESASRLGAGVDVRLRQGKKIQLQGRADLNAPWREAASTISYGGSYTGLTGHVYALPFGDRVIVDLGARLRTMELQTMSSDETSDGSQSLLLGGVDYVVWVDPTRTARGQILDEEMIWPAYMADSIVLSYRHYEAFTRDDFGDRLVMSERNSIDEGSFAARKTLAAGILGGELRGGAGYDQERATRLWRAGASLVVSPSKSSRFTLTYDFAKESTSGFVGERQAGWLGYHVDL